MHMMKSGSLTMAGLGSELRIITDSLDDAGNTTAFINNGLASNAAALAESEERFRQMAEMTGEWLWEQDPGGYYTYSSTAVNQILGFSPDEVIGKHYTEFLTPLDKADQQPYAAVHQPFYALLNHYRHKDGHQVLTESSGLPIIDAKGKLLKWRGVDRDITARKHFQDALIESEKCTRLIIESSLSAIVIMDSYGIITDWNPQAEKMFGWSRNEAIGQRLQDLIIPPRFRKAHQKGLQHFLHTGIGPLLNQLTEQTAIRRGGSEFPVELSISPLKLGNTYIFSGFIHDITARKRLEHRFRQAVESAPNAIVMVNESGTIEMVNAQTETFFGYPRTELIGQPVEILVPERFRSAHIGLRQAYLAAPPVSRPMGMGRDLYGLRKDGSEFPVEIGLSPIDSHDETLVLSTIVDITTRKATEAKIRQAQVNLAIAQSEIKIAQRIQASLSPSAPIKSEHFEVTGFCLPADQVGGDYFDYFFRNKDHLDMIIADVSGHSIGPALFMVETRSAIRTQANGLGTPAETLTTLNNFLFEDLDKADYFITLFYLQYDVTYQQLSFANAGHPPPLLLRSFQNECRQLDAEGLILGVNKKVFFEEKTTTLSKGDLILLYTDGLTEAENANGEFFGLERVSDIFIQYSHQAPQKIIDALLEQLKQFCQSESFNDDITLMIFKQG
jgi:PAS domain S-box-containing protein